MTAPTPQFALKAASHYQRLRGDNGNRDAQMQTVKTVRDGNMRQLFPAELDLNVEFGGVPIANTIDAFAHDIAEGIAPLPSLACVSGKMESDADAKRADLKNKIGSQYWQDSRLSTQMQSAADQYVSFGFLPFFVEPDTECGRPYIQAMNPLGSYYEKDRYDRVTVFAHHWWRTVDELCALYPEWAHIIRDDGSGKGKERPANQKLELVQWVDKTQVMLFLPSHEGLVLGSYLHKLKRTPVHVAERPGISDKPRGQFDDVVYVQVARAIMATLQLEAAQIAVQAPIALPRDFDELAIGPHSIIRTDNPEKIRRISLDLPSNIFAEGQQLADEEKIGSRYPDARLGESNASVITGKGVEALLGTFDSQIRGCQEVMKLALQEVTSICFEMDETWWPNKVKTVCGVLAGKSYEGTYRPSKDINGRYECTVTYGFAMGMKPAQSIITILQLLGAGLISKGTAQENMPITLDYIQESKDMDIEDMRNATKQSVFALVQTIGPMAAQGQDPTLLVKISADMITERRKGTSIEDAFLVALGNYQQATEAAKQKQMEQMQAQMAAQGGGAGPGGPAGPGGDAGGGDTGLSPAGVPDGHAPGQAGMAPGGQPTISRMISGFRGDGNLPVMQATTQRVVPTGGQ
jgi:hypothetical protein